MKEPLFELTVFPRQVFEDPQGILKSHGRIVLEALAEVAEYINCVLTSASPVVGRAGAICPFVGRALRSDMITLSVLLTPTADLVVLREAVLTLKAGFSPIDEIAGSIAEALRAAVIVMPCLETAAAAQVVETVQKALKPEMIASGLMIGEFYPGCTAPGLNNPAFRPADTPFACLAIRRMVASDLPFLIGEIDSVGTYLARFGDEGRRRLDAVSARGERQR